ARKVYGIDVHEGRLAIAREYGARTFSAHDPDWVAKIRAATRGYGVDRVLEMSGAAEAFHRGLDALGRDGASALLGLHGEPVSIDLNEKVIFRQITLKGINGRRMFATWQQVDAL